jgi:hypothetical protein
VIDACSFSKQEQGCSAIFVEEVAFILKVTIMMTLCLHKLYEQ